jgi:hypothetical protein
MVDLEQLIRRDLDQLIELPAELEPDWDDIQRRLYRLQPPRVSAAAAGVRILRSVRRRPLLALLILLVAALIPVSALAVAKSDPWWFLRFQPLGLGPAKGTQVVVIKQGSWSGQPWVLTAYRNRQGHLCFQLTGKATNGRPSPQQGAGGCASIPGAGARGPDGRPLTITYLSSGLSATNGHGEVRYLVGPVVNKATEVVVTLANGTSVRTPTFSAPAALGVSSRFYAAQLPTAPTGTGTQLSCRQRVLRSGQVAPQRLVGLDSAGHTVAELDVPARPTSLTAALCQPHRNHFVVPTYLPAADRALTTVARITGPYHATATIAVGRTVPIPTGRILPSGAIKHVLQPSRCWRVTFSNGQSQGTCTPETKRHNPEYWLEVQHAGRDTFVIVQATPRTGPAITRIALQLANGKVLSAKPIDGIVVFAIPRTALSTTKSQRGWLIGYDKNGRQVSYYNATAHVEFDRQAVYYRSCPPGSSCY